ncbi:hypothetical protein LX36DRAFT_258986 [Colletotrichum falcatum]|nr:hypothetical protein LX36DRAFT_258986 [Colletotrichum falcatum]
MSCRLTEKTASQIRRENRRVREREGTREWEGKTRGGEERNQCNKIDDEKEAWRFHWAAGQRLGEIDSERTGTESERERERERGHGLGVSHSTRNRIRVSRGLKRCLPRDAICSLTPE